MKNSISADKNSVHKTQIILEVSAIWFKNIECNQAIAIRKHTWKLKCVRVHVFIMNKLELTVNIRIPVSFQESWNEVYLNRSPSTWIRVKIRAIPPFAHKILNSRIERFLFCSLHWRWHCFVFSIAPHTETTKYAENYHVRTQKSNLFHDWLQNTERPADVIR